MATKHTNQNDRTEHHPLQHHYQTRSLVTATITTYDVPRNVVVLNAVEQFRETPIAVCLDHVAHLRIDFRRITHAVIVRRAGRPLSVTRFSYCTRTTGEQHSTVEPCGEDVRRNVLT